MKTIETEWTNISMDKNIWLPKDFTCVQRINNVREFDLLEWKRVEPQMRVLFLNLMPEKEKTEWDIVRTLAACGVEVQLLPMKISGQSYKTTPMLHMQQFYLNFQAYEPYHFDRFIVTGAPLEQIPFEQVRYWEQLQYIMHWANTHVDRTLYICWGAQAALYEYYGINKQSLPQKMFGIFEQQILQPSSPLMRGYTDGIIKMPHSRHTEITSEEVEQHLPELEILAQSKECGVGIVATRNLGQVFVLGHLEYNALTLNEEYQRDLKKQLPISPPQYYYGEDGAISYSWQQDAIRFYHNWLVEES